MADEKEVVYTVPLNKDGTVVALVASDGSARLGIDVAYHRERMIALGWQPNRIEFQGDTQTVVREYWEPPITAQTTRAFDVRYRKDVPIGSLIMLHSSTHSAAGYVLRYVGATAKSHLNCEYTNTVMGHHNEGQRVYVDPVEDVTVIELAR